MSDSTILNVICPCCKAALTVDPATGDVLMHKEAKTTPVLDIVQAAQALKKDSGRREDLFRKSIESEKRKGSRLDKQFEEGLKRAKEDPGSPPPPREIDLD